MFKNICVDSYRVSLNFKHVKGEDNPCDLITRGLSFAEFNKKRSFWLKGPEWLSTYRQSWPDSNLGCLSAASKQLTQHANVSVSFNFNVGPQDDGTLVDIQKYFDLNKLFRVTSDVFQRSQCHPQKTNWRSCSVC